MERVQFQQEQMLAELKDLVEKKLFTPKETKLIMKKRTEFETALVRRVAKKSDFLRYAAYEMGMEQLRRKRVERLKLPPGPATVSDYALVRRQFHIFERALKKFKSDVGLWIQYIDVAKREGARALVGRITARALQLHPNTPALYILAASHELSHFAPTAARTLLQRGIRLNAESVEMWREYVRMELGFIESLRRRWDILGISDVGGSGKGKEKAKETDLALDVDMDGESQIEAANGEDAKLLQGDEEGAAARKEIMDGGIVKSVISSAVRALPRIELFESLDELIRMHPSPPALRQAMIAHLDKLLRATLPDHPRTLRILASRLLTQEMKGDELVEGIRRANEMLLKSASDSNKEEVLEVYSDFVEEWCKLAIDASLKVYLIKSLEMIIHGRRRSPSLLSAHIRLLMQSEQRETAEGSAKLLRTARKYTARVPGSGRVWVERLMVEKALGTDRAEVEKAWAEARRAVKGSEAEVSTIWAWGLITLIAGDSEEDKRRVHEELLKESMRDSNLRSQHEMVLISYVTVAHEGRMKPEAGMTSDQEAKKTARWRESLRHMEKCYLVSAKVEEKVRELESEIREDAEVSTVG